VIAAALDEDAVAVEKDRIGALYIAVLAARLPSIVTPAAWATTASEYRPDCGAEVRLPLSSVPRRTRGPRTP
jgi:hypothetical protein